MSWTKKAAEVGRMDADPQKLMEPPSQEQLGWGCWENGDEWVIGYGTGTMQTSKDTLVLPNQSEEVAIELCETLNGLGIKPV